MKGIRGFKGCGAGSGSKAQPFPTTRQARDAQRKARQRNPAEPVTVWLHSSARRLPSAESIDRYTKHTKASSLGYDILDRKP
jgi:hypothetical protein